MDYINIGFIEQYRDESKMRLAYGEGVAAAILAPIVLYLFGQLNISQTLFLILLLVGGWTIFSSFIFMKQNERIYYLSWGLVIACISTAFVTRIQYSIALIIVAVLAVLFVNASTRSNSRRNSAARLQS